MPLLREKFDISYEPSLTRGSTMIATVEQALNTPAANHAAIVASLKGVRKNYAGVPALCGVDFNVHSGEIVALLGPNGAGKTTAVKLLLGLMLPSAGGSACTWGRSYESGKPKAYRRHAAGRTRAGDAARSRAHRFVFGLLPKADAATRSARFCPGWCARLRWRCRPTIYRNSHSELWGRDDTNRPPRTGRSCWLSA